MNSTTRSFAYHEGKTVKYGTSMNQIDDHPGVVGPNDKVMVARNRRVSQGSRKKIVYDTHYNEPQSTTYVRSTSHLEPFHEVRKVRIS
jgi:hypothetical protein